jgi:hypothetical protein
MLTTEKGASVILYMPEGYHHRNIYKYLATPVAFIQAWPDNVHSFQD